MKQTAHAEIKSKCDHAIIGLTKIYNVIVSILLENINPGPHFG